MTSVLHRYGWNGACQVWKDSVRYWMRATWRQWYTRECHRRVSGKGQGMDGSRFDKWTKKVATGPSRRRVIAGLAGGALAALGLGIGDQSVEAARTPRPPRRITSRANNGCPVDSGCFGRPCGNGKDCFCGTTVEDKAACFSLERASCSNQQCESSSECGSGAACIRPAECCDFELFGVCIPLCGAPS